MNTKRGKTNLRSSRASYCKECLSEIRLRNLLRKKYDIIQSICNGKCSECDAGISFLPCFEFHHPNPSLKTTTWTHIKHYSNTNITNKTQESFFPYHNTYCLTELGKNILEELKDSYQKIYDRLEIDIFSMEDYMKDKINGYNNCF